MNTRPDGTRSTTNMFLWQPLAGAFYAPCVDGDFDMSVIGHEYGHMIENRMIGKGVRRQGDHAGAMGESFGDMNAMEYLNEYGFAPVSHENRYAIGPYVTSNPYRGIRNYAMNFPYAGKAPAAEPLSVREPTEPERRRLRLRRRAGARGRRDLERDELRHPPPPDREVRPRQPLASARMRGRRPAGGAVPGEPALVPALLRRDAADAGCAVVPRRPQRDPRRGRGPVRRREPA